MSMSAGGTVNLTAGSGGVDVNRHRARQRPAHRQRLAPGQPTKSTCTSLHASSYAELQAVASITSSGGNTTITVTGGDTITLVGEPGDRKLFCVPAAPSSAMH